MSHPDGISYLYAYSYRLCRVALMVFYITSLLRLLQIEHWRRRLSALACAGRMPLTNYLLQTAMGLLIFRPWGLGLYGQAGPAVDFALAVMLYCLVQLPFSAYWLRHFRFGPMEYLWRFGTYGKMPRLRLDGAN
jgi:uncharacterized protein